MSYLIPQRPAIPDPSLYLKNAPPEVKRYLELLYQAIIRRDDEIQKAFLKVESDIAAL